MSIDIESMSTKELAAFIAKASQLHKKSRWKRKPATAVRKQIHHDRQAGWLYAGRRAISAGDLAKGASAGKAAKKVKAAKKPGRKS